MREIENQPWPRACLQVYTGNGKGKTTAALGLALRAAGRGLKVFIGQFMKGTYYGELTGVDLQGDLIHIEQFGSAHCIPLRDPPHQEDINLADAGMKRSLEVLTSGEYPIVILDEISVAVHFQLISESDMLDLLDARPSHVELICTGRYATPSLIDRADLVTEMRVVKHPYDAIGLGARDGIER
ncbi:MAG: cob(I)yrinic acid a,c-diamide adenosyltransferase [Myxococcota bacterium]|nr:cob(I)yrinic acid a,c-diamide adenosyltransferase [Myxococcota bacterium]